MRNPERVGSESQEAWQDVAAEEVRVEEPVSPESVGLEPTVAEQKIGRVATVGAASTSLRRNEVSAENTAGQIEEPWERRREFVAADTAEFLLENYSPEELEGHPERRFNVNPAKFPIFRDQAAIADIRSGRNGVNIHSETLNINEVFGRHIACTADTVAALTGEYDEFTRQERLEPADAVVYLDKSARPVRWMLDAFWDEFTEKPRPERENCLLIDRLTWLRAVGVNVRDDGNLMDDRGEKPELRPADFGDFLEGIKEHPISRSTLARMRIAMIPDGIKALISQMTPEQRAELKVFNPLSDQELRGDDKDMVNNLNQLPEWLIDLTFATPTGLEGKTVTVIDEVKNSGATADIAEYLLSQAIADPETKFQKYVYWPYGFVVTDGQGNSRRQMDNTPVWYDHDENKELGKGVGNLDPDALSEAYKQDPSLENLTALYAAPFTGRPLDLTGAEGESTMELKREITWMSALYRTGHGFMNAPKNYDFDRFEEHCNALGIQVAPGEDRKDTVVGLMTYFSKHRP